MKVNWKLEQKTIKLKMWLKGAGKFRFYPLNCPNVCIEGISMWLAISSVKSGGEEVRWMKSGAKTTLVSSLRTFFYLLTQGTNKHRWLLLKGLFFTGTTNRSRPDPATPRSTNIWKLPGQVTPRPGHLWVGVTVCYGLISKLCWWRKSTNNNI